PLPRSGQRRVPNAAKGTRPDARRRQQRAGHEHDDGKDYGVMAAGHDSYLPGTGTGNGVAARAPAHSAAPSVSSARPMLAPTTVSAMASATPWQVGGIPASASAISRSAPAERGRP